jgi:hypothetical protein
MKARILLSLILTLLLTTGGVKAQSPIPYTFTNNSAYADANVYIAIIGIVNGNSVWVNPKNGSVNVLSTSNNTVPGPVIGGNQGPGGNGLYANCFAKLSDIPNKTVTIPPIAGCRIMVSFNSQLYLYFFGGTGGYAAPNLANPTDPNQGIRFETIELAITPTGMWANTSRVDAYQYPMGLEVWGNSGFYQKVGEYVPHAQILSAWQATAPAEFAGCYNPTNGIIQAPSKTTPFQSGAQANYFGTYVDAIWAKYRTGNLIFGTSESDTWTGSVSGDVFTFRRSSDGATGTITRKPTTIEVLEGSGALASGSDADKAIQTQICAAINRHAINLNTAVGVRQDFSPASNYYQTTPYNWYANFWHRSDLTLNSKAYGFCYDDVFDQSSTINSPSPLRATVTIGGFAGISQPTGVTTMYKDCNYGGYAIGLNTGSYTLSQLNALGILNDDISSLRVNSGYKVTLYENDNFGGASVVFTGDDDCLVDNSWNDRASSLKVEANTPATSIVIQAEDYNFMSGVQTEATTDAGGGLDVGYIDAGDWMSYAVTIPTPGNYTVTYRVATTAANMTLRLEKDAGATQLGTVTLPNTGGWQNWANVSQVVSLPAGSYSIGIATATGGFNLNYLTITSAAAAPTVAVSLPTETAAATTVTVAPNPVKDQLYIHGNETVNVLSIYDMSGRRVMSVRKPDTSISVASLPPGVYVVVLDRNDGTSKKVKVVKN